MYMGKLGSKSMAFINHKPFHPGNKQNMERVWLAEKKQEEKEKMLKEALEKRTKELQLEKLQKLVRQNAEQGGTTITTGTDHSASYLNFENDQPLKKKKKQSSSSSLPVTVEKKKTEQMETIPLSIPSSFAEDVYENNHTSIFGSFYCKESNKWGYACCSSLNREEECGKSVLKRKALEEEQQNKSKKKKGLVH